MDGCRADAESLGRFPDDPAGGGFSLGFAEDGLADEVIDFARQPFSVLDGESVVFSVDDSGQNR